MRRLVCLTVVLALSGWSAAASAAEFDVSMSSLLGGDGDDAVVAAVLQSDKSIVLAANFAGSTPTDSVESLGEAAGDDAGHLVVLEPDGAEIRAVYRVGRSVHDLAVDEQDNIYVAAGDSGLIKLSSSLALEWTKTPGHIRRVDVGAGLVVGLQPDNTQDADNTPGRGTVHVYESSDVADHVDFDGHRNTLDVCYSAPTETFVTVGWRQARADGNPVQIAYLRGTSRSGQTLWTAYDWSTDNDSDDFINRPENNMADTRGYRCAVSPDGDVYAAFETAGGNHIFRYDPFDISTKVDIVGGDKYHEFYNTASEHKLFFARYDAETGEYVRGQQLTGRLSSDDSGNTVRIKEGALAVGDDGKVYLVGSAAFGLPLTFRPEGTGEYTGGAYLVVMDADLDERLYVTRMTPNGAGNALAVRSLSDGARVVYGGSTQLENNEFHAVDPLQTELGGGERDGFVTVLGGEAGDPVDPGGNGGGAGDDSGASDDSNASAGCGCATSDGSHDVSWAFVLLLWAVSRASRRGRGW